MASFATAPRNTTATHAKPATTSATTALAKTAELARCLGSPSSACARRMSTAKAANTILVPSCRVGLVHASQPTRTSTCVTAWTDTSASAAAGMMHPHPYQGNSHSKIYIVTHGSWCTVKPQLQNKCRTNVTSYLVA
ncbi:uncharacterized protein LOC119722582 [Patiria miniata]|uniref:Uncharacterized protein n=1 Tax=Patiria miniata TaxID=46514 RepID=A0A913ZCM8_PATMI|nr:uncharacterized protein LOC119722582 [Patiria miniata]